MPGFAIVTDEELDRARRDPAFRHVLVTQNLDMLLSALNRLRATNAPGKAEAAQIQEGAQLAVQLSDILHRLAETQNGLAAKAAGRR